MCAYARYRSFCPTDPRVDNNPPSEAAVAAAAALHVWLARVSAAAPKVCVPPWFEIAC